MMTFAQSAQMITTALAVGSDNTIVLGAGPTFGILCAILCFHGVVCSAATSIIARINIFYVIINGKLALPLLGEVDPSWSGSGHDDRCHHNSVGLLRRQEGLFKRRLYPA